MDRVSRACVTAVLRTVIGAEKAATSVKRGTLGPTAPRSARGLRAHHAASMAIAVMGSTAQDSVRAITTQRQDGGLVTTAAIACRTGMGQCAPQDASHHRGGLCAATGPAMTDPLEMASACAMLGSLWTATKAALRWVSACIAPAASTARPVLRARQITASRAAEMAYVQMVLTVTAPVCASLGLLAPTARCHVASHSVPHAERGLALPMTPVRASVGSHCRTERAPCVTRVFTAVVVT